MTEFLGVVITWDLVQKWIITSIVTYVGLAVVNTVFSLVGYGFCTCLWFVLVDMAAVGLVTLISQLRINPYGRAVLVTGCDSGFGHALVKELHELGFTVFAGCLLADKGGDGSKKLKALKSPRLHVLQLDVTSEDSVSQAVSYVKANLPRNAPGLWALVNNAGISTYGEVEFMSMKGYKSLLEVNLIGTIITTRAFLPMLRASKGRVVNVASVLGRMCSPQRSAYAISKWAVEAFSDTLRFDMKRWGVEVVVIEPGNHVLCTDIFSGDIIGKQAEEMWSQMSPELRTDYGREYFDSKVEQMREFTRIGTADIYEALMMMTDAVSCSYPQRRYQPVMLKEKVRVFVYAHFPERVFEWLYL